MKLLQSINSPDLITYWGTITDASKNAYGTPLCISTEKVFLFERFCDANQLNNVHKVDALTIKTKTGTKSVNLIEFKGGKDLIPDAKNCFALKGFDSIHCGILKLLGDDITAWLELFSLTCDITYYIVCSDNNVIFIDSIPGLEKLKSRAEINVCREKLRNLKDSLKYYENKHPYIRIVITYATAFIKYNLHDVV